MDKLKLAIQSLETHITYGSVIGRKDIVMSAMEADNILALLKEQEDLGTELTNAVELIHKKNERIENLLKEQEHKDKMFHALEDDWKRLKELLKEQEAVEKVLNDLYELGYPHNFQHEAPWVVDYLYELTEIIKKAFKIKKVGELNE